MVTQRLAELALAVQYEALPVEVTEMAKRCILDGTACALAGLQEAPARIVREAVVLQGGRAESRLLGTGSRVPALQAALANATAAHALDYDDVNVAIPGHATAVVMPAVLACGEAQSADGRQLIAAFVAGYETACRVGLLVGSGHYDRGFHATSTAGAIGAAAACANLMRLTPAQTASALSLAATQASGLKAMFGNMAKPLHAGYASRNGLHAAALAREGFDAGSDAMEHPQGFARVLSGDFHPARALEEPASFHITRNLFKFHAACYGVQAAIDCGNLIREQLSRQQSPISSVRVTANPASDRYCNIAEPATGNEGKFSLRLNVAFGLLGRDTTRLDAYTDASVRAPQAVALRDCVSVGFSEELPMMKAEVEVTTADGRRYTAALDAGIPDRDLQRQAARVGRKFVALVEPVLGPKATARLRDQILGLESLKPGDALLA